MQTKYYQTFDCKIPNILQSNQKYLLQAMFCISVYVQPGIIWFANGQNVYIAIESIHVICHQIHCLYIQDRDRFTAYLFKHCIAITKTSHVGK